MTKKRINSAYEFLQEKNLPTPEILIVLGSGLGDYVDGFSDAKVIPYTEIPGFPKPTVEGHQGNLIFGKKHGKNIVVMQGRFHCYEGYTPQEVVIPLRVLIRLGISKLLLTNACGGVNENFKSGDLMIITDHLNLPNYNPLMGENFDEFGPRFCDMTYTYSPKLIKVLQDGSDKLNIGIHKGVYCFWSGPSFETPAEIKMSRILGGDVVGMSTVPEAIVANHAGIELAGISCITNLAAGITADRLSHQEVLETGKLAGEKTKKLIDYFVSNV